MSEELKPSPDVVDAMARAMSWMRPLAEDQMPDDALTSASEIMIMRLKDRGYTIVKSEPAMSEAELEREAMALTTPFITIEKSVSLAKKYRGS